MAAPRGRVLRETAKPPTAANASVRTVSFLGRAAVLSAVLCPAMAAALGTRARCLANKLQGGVPSGTMPVRWSKPSWRSRMRGISAMLRTGRRAAGCDTVFCLEADRAFRHRPHIADSTNPSHPPAHQATCEACGAPATPESCRRGPTPALTELTRRTSPYAPPPPAHPRHNARVLG